MSRVKYGVDRRPGYRERARRAVTPGRSPENIKLESELSELLEAYKNALRFASRLPRLGRVRVEITPSEPAKPKRSSSKKQFVQLFVHIRRLLDLLLGKNQRLIARPFVQLFVEGHIRKKIDLLLDILRIEAISLDEDAKRVELWTKHLKQARESLRSWGNTYFLLTRAPLISLLLPFLPPVLLYVFGFDISGPNGIVKSVITLYQTRGSLIVSALATWAILLFYLYAFLAPAVVRLGFRCKRAIFNAGITDDYHLLGKFVIKEEKWEGFPGANIYHRENDVFKTLGITKPREFPLDLVLTPVPYIALVFACVITFYVVDMLKAGTFPAFGQWFAFFVAWAWTIGIVAKARRYYLERKQQECM